MRTRRSPRNQDRLWKALSEPSPPKPAKTPEVWRVVTGRPVTLLGPRTAPMLYRGDRFRVMRALASGGAVALWRGRVYTVGAEALTDTTIAGRIK